VSKEQAMKTGTAKQTHGNRFEAREHQSRRNGVAVWYWVVIDTATDALCGFGDRRACVALALKLEAESVADRDGVAA
jgi:hypothetical protein